MNSWWGKFSSQVPLNYAIRQHDDVINRVPVKVKMMTGKHDDGNNVCSDCLVVKTTIHVIIFLQVAGELPKLNLWGKLSMSVTSVPSDVVKWI